MPVAVRRLCVIQRADDMATQNLRPWLAKIERGLEETLSECVANLSKARCDFLFFTESDEPTLFTQRLLDCDFSEAQIAHMDEILSTVCPVCMLADRLFPARRDSTCVACAKAQEVAAQKKPQEQVDWKLVEPPSGEPRVMARPEPSAAAAAAVGRIHWERGRADGIAMICAAVQKILSELDSDMKFEEPHPEPWHTTRLRLLAERSAFRGLQEEYGTLTKRLAAALERLRLIRETAKLPDDNQAG